MLKLKKTYSLCAALSCTALFAAAAHAAALDRAVVADALAAHLARHGDLCLGKFDWPIDVSAIDFETKTRDALQMPVLEKLGLVVSVDGTTTYEGDDSKQVVASKRYVLTDTGRKYYLARETTSRVAGGGSVTHHADFCAGHLALKDVVRWDEATATGGDAQTTVTYTYRFSPAPWAVDPAARKVFPMVDRIIKGQGTLQLQQRFRISGAGLTPIDSLE